MKRIRRDERGSSLIIALAFLVVFSLWLSATLSATESGMHIAQTMKIQPKRLYAADAAIEKAIQRIRYDEAAGRWDDPGGDEPGCNDTVITLQDPAQTVYVQCEPDGNSGRGDEGESSPPVGIIALSNGALGEFAYQQYGNSIVRIDGGAFSGTPLLFQNGNECSGGAVNNCQQLNLCPRNEKIITDGVLVRNTAAVTSLSGPWIPADVGVPIVGNGIPAGTTIESYLGPGLITMSRNATVSGVNRTIRFRENYPPLQSHCRPPADPEELKKGKITGVPRLLETESCDQARIVARQFNCDATYIPDPIGIDPGYPVDRSSGFPNRNVPSCSSFPRVVELEEGRYTDAAALTALTTSCDKLIWFKPGTYYFDFPDANPVWTIGASNLGNLTIVGGAKTWDREPFTACASYNNGTKLTTVTASSAVFKASDANSAWINAGYNLPYKTQIKTVSPDKKSASFSGQALTNNWCGLYTVSPIAGASNPLGSLCDPATHVDHPGVEFVFGGQSQLVATDGKFEICSPVVGTRQQVAMYGVVNQQQVLRPQSGCITAQPYTPGGGAACAMIKAPQGSKPAFIVHGTIYAPKAVIDLSLQGVGYQIVSRGIIARVVALSISPSAQFTDPIIYSPDFGSIPGAPRKMVLTACLNAPCIDGGTPKLRALIRIKDDDENNNPGVPGFKVFVDSWSVL